MKKENVLDFAGKFIIENFFDKGIEAGKMLLNGSSNSEEIKIISEKLNSFDTESKALVEKIIIKVLTNSLHDFLFALEENNDLKGEIQFLFKNINIANESDGLQGELFSENGWIMKYSHFKDEIKS